MAFPAIPIVQSFAIGIPVCLAGFAAQELLIRRRMSRRPAGGAGATAKTAPGEALEGADVTVVTAPTPQTDLAAPVEARPARPARPRERAARKPAGKPAPGVPRPAAPRKVAARSAAAATPRPAPRPARAATARRDPAAALRKRHDAMQSALEALITFVDGAPRRAAATACADALLLAVPKAERGPGVSSFLRAAGAREAPGKLQEIAEDAGLELATAIKTIGERIRAREEA